MTGHVGNWEMGAVTLRRHGLTPAVVGQPELSPRVQEMRQQLRDRVGVESIDIGTSMATALQVRAAVDRGRAVALLVDRAYPEDRSSCRSSGARRRSCAPPRCSPASAAARSCPASSCAARTARTTTSGASRSTPIPRPPPEEDAVRMMSRVAADLERVDPRPPDAVVQLLPVLGGQVADRGVPGSLGARCRPCPTLP